MTEIDIRHRYDDGAPSKYEIVVSVWLKSAYDFDRVRHVLDVLQSTTSEDLSPTGVLLSMEQLAAEAGSLPP